MVKKTIRILAFLIAALSISFANAATKNLYGSNGHIISLSDTGGVCYYNGTSTGCVQLSYSASYGSGTHLSALTLTGGVAILTQKGTGGDNILEYSNSSLKYCSAHVNYEGKYFFTGGLLYAYYPQYNAYQRRKPSTPCVLVGDYQDISNPGYTFSSNLNPTSDRSTTPPTTDDIIFRGELTRTYDSPNGWYIDGIYTGKPLTFHVYVDGSGVLDVQGSNYGETTIESFSDELYSELKTYSIHIDYTLSGSTEKVNFSDFTYRPIRVDNEAGGWINYGWNIKKYPDQNPKGFSLENFSVNTDTRLITYVDGIVVDRIDYGTGANFYEFRHSDIFKQARTYNIKLRSINKKTSIFYDFASFQLTPVYAIGDSSNIFDQDCRFTQYTTVIRCSDFFDNNDTDLTFNLFTSQGGKYYMYGSGTTISYTGSTRYKEVDGNTVLWSYDWTIPYGLPTYDYTLYVEDSIGQIRGAFEFHHESTLGEGGIKELFSSGGLATDITQIVPVDAEGNIDTETWIQSLTRTIDNIRKFMNMGNDFTTQDVKVLNWIVPSVHAAESENPLINSTINKLSEERGSTGIDGVLNVYWYGLMTVIFIFSLVAILYILK